MGYVVAIFIIGMIGYGMLKDRLDAWAKAKARDQMQRSSGNSPTDEEAARERERVRLEYQRRAEELRRKRAIAAGQPLPPPAPPPSAPSRPAAPTISKSVNSPSTSSPSSMNAPTPTTAYRTRSHADDVRQQQDARRREREAREARETMQREQQRARELDMEVERARNAGRILKNTLAQRALSAKATVIAKAKSAAARAAGMAPTTRPSLPPQPAAAASAPPTPQVAGNLVGQTTAPRPAGSPVGNRVPGMLMGVSLRQAMVIKEILDPPVSMRKNHLDAGM